MDVRRTIAGLALLAAVFFAGSLSNQADTTTNYDNCVAIEKLTKLLGTDGQNHTEQNSPRHTNNSDCSPPKWYAIFQRVEGWQLVVAVIGIGVISYQSWLTKLAAEATRKSAESAQRSIELQAVQWIVLKDWRGSLSRPDWLNVEVDVVNETSFPLTLQHTVFRVGSKVYESAMDVTIVPKEGHAVGFVRDLSTEESSAYLSSHTVFGIRGAIWFKGFSGNNEVQPFGGLISASSAAGITFVSRSEYIQSAKEHYGDEDPPT